MEEYSFYEGQLPSAYRYQFEQYLFNRSEYRLLQSATNWISFYLLDGRELTVHGHVHFYSKGDIARSTIQSPFGGLEISDAVDNKTLFHFIRFVEDRLKHQGLHAIEVVNPPLSYNISQVTRIETFMINLGFAVTRAELSSIIPVSTNSLSALLHPRKRRKLGQTLLHGLRFEELPAQSLKMVYDFIAHLRSEKNYALSISFEHLFHSVNVLPQAYVLFGVFDGERLVAASVAVRVSQQILYHFISDHVRKIGEAKPALMLMQGIYTYCQQNGITHFDLGTSAKDTLPNFKLIRFKTEIGGVLTHKFSMSKKLL